MMFYPNQTPFLPLSWNVQVIRLFSLPCALMHDWGSKALLVGWESVKAEADGDICNSSDGGSLGSAALESKGCCACLNKAARLAWKRCSRPFQPRVSPLSPLFC